MKRILFLKGTALASIIFFDTSPLKANIKKGEFLGFNTIRKLDEGIIEI